MPVTGLCFLVGALAMGGIPLFNGFMSKLTIFLACAKAEMLWATVAAVVTSLLTLFCLLHAAYRVFMGKGVAVTDHANEAINEVSPLMWGGMAVLALLCFVIGVYPQMVFPILDESTRAISAMAGPP
jgi:formate hydrogenlyase subunit 3/multisubunit Na+/H+ antiporter MnhD subunit